MPGPRGNHRSSGTDPHLDGARVTTFMLLRLPPEVILHIVAQLGVRDLLALKRTNRLLYGVTREKSLWERVLRNFHPPLSRTSRSQALDDLSRPTLENAVLDLWVVEERWRKTRKTGLILTRLDKHTETRALDFLDDRWIVLVPAQGVPTIWDTLEDPPKRCKFHESASPFFQDKTSDASAAVDPHQGDIIIWLLRESYEISPQILRVHLGKTDSLRCTVYEAIEPLSYGKLAWEPSRNLVIMEHYDVGIRVGNWISGQAFDITNFGQDNDYRCGVTRDVRPVGDYILAFKSCCVELVSISPFPGEEGQAHGTDPAFHRFHLARSELFSDASLSEPQPSPDSASNSLIVYALACGTCFGCFYFRITIHDPNYVPSGPRAKVDIDLLGFYRLEEYSWLYGTLLGPEGKRGFWIQRAPSSRQEILVTVSFDQSRPETMELQSGDDFEEICEAAPPMEPGVSTWVLGPWDKGEYFVRCAFSEATGRIVTETGNNTVILL